MLLKQKIISSKSSTSEVILDPKGMRKIEGCLIHQDLSEFFKQLEYWIDECINNPADQTSFDIHLEYLNGVNSIAFITFLKKIALIKQKDKKLIINLYYKEGDEDIFEQDEFLSSILNVPFDFVMISEPIINRQRSLKICAT
jgi:acetoin utilization deacetylase AcuC-like enzyme